MRKAVLALILIASIFYITGCASQTEKGPAIPIEVQMSESHQAFEEKESFTQTAVSICGGMVICGIVFKTGAIISGIISGKRIGRKVKKAREQSSNYILNQEISCYQVEILRHDDYLKKHLPQKDR